MASIIAASKISTIVRFVGYGLLRLRFRIQGWLVPDLAARSSADLFCTPFPGSRARALAVDDTSATKTMLNVDGQQIATYIWGDPRTQPYVLLAHGWSSHGLRHLPWVEALRSEGYAIVAFDQTAHGRSTGTRATLPDFACNLIAVGHRFGPAAAVIAHSLGGAAASLALRHGLQASRAILLAPAADPIGITEYFARNVGIPESVRRRMVTLLEHRTRVGFEAMQAHRVAPMIAQPALIVHDLEDPEVPWADGERYARYWPDSRLLTTTGLGHHRVAHDSAVIAAAIAFLRGEIVGQRVVSSPNLPYGLA